MDYTDFVLRSAKQALAANLMWNSANWVCTLSHVAAAGVGFGLGGLVVLSFVLAQDAAADDPRGPAPYDDGVGRFINVRGEEVPGHIRMVYEVVELTDHYNNANYVYEEVRAEVVPW